MGINLPKPYYDAGNDCLTCFAANTTPDKVYVRFFLVDPCVPHTPPACKVPPNDRVFVVPQQPGFPCNYDYVDANWHVQFTFNLPGPHRSWLLLTDQPGFLYFSDTIPGCMPDGHVFHNSYVACGALECASGGIGIVSWTHEALDLMAKLVIPTGDTTFMEFFADAANNNVYRFASHYFRMNLKVKAE